MSLNIITTHEDNGTYQHITLTVKTSTFKHFQNSSIKIVIDYFLIIKLSLKYIFKDKK